MQADPSLWAGCGHGGCLVTEAAAARSTFLMSLAELWSEKSAFCVESTFPCAMGPRMSK